jgi:DNA-directed RNA polymerase specialized sigma24 family protein
MEGGRMNRVTGKDAERLRDYFLSLPVGDRLLLLLTFSDGLTPEEAAAVLHRAEREVRAQIQRLMNDARQALGLRRAAAGCASTTRCVAAAARA